MEIIKKKISIVGKMIELIKKLNIPFENPKTFSEGCLNYTYKGDFKGDEAVLKIYNPRVILQEERFTNELKVLQKLQGLEIIPELLDCSEKEKWIITRFIQGDNFKKREMEGKKIDISSIVECLTSVHSQETDSKGDAYKDYLKERVSKLQHLSKESRLDGELLGYIERALKYMEESIPHLNTTDLSRVNGDLNGSNMIFAEDGKMHGLVDWEFSHIGSKYLDIAQFTNRENDEISRGVKDQYFQGDLDKKVYEFFLVHFLVKICLNNSPHHIERMAFPREEKQRIVKSKTKRLIEMFK